MSKTKNGWMVAFNVILTIYLILCIVAGAVWIYFKFFKPDSFTESSIYANEVEDVNGKKTVMEINSYNNLFEIKFNYYSDYNSTDVIGSGIQILNYEDLRADEIRTDGWHWSRWYSFLSGPNGQYNYDSKNLCFYQESDGLSYTGISDGSDEFGCLKIEIDGISYALKLGRVMNVEEGLLWTTISTKSSLSLLIKNMYEIYHNGKFQSGTYYLTFPFKDYFDVYKFDGKKYELIETDIFDTYIYTKFTNYNEDAKTAKDSIFGQVQYNSNWVKDKSQSLLNEYFSDSTIFKLTEQNCKFTFDETVNKHIADINDKTYNEYKDKKQNYTIVFDLDYLNTTDILFGGVNKDGRIKDLNITSYYTLSNGVLTEVTL